jgi:predicted transcriptional regulator
MTAEIVSAYVRNNPVTAAAIPELIDVVCRSLHQANSPVAVNEAEPPRPAVPVRKSIAPDYLVCLEDGKKMKMLKRHLRTVYNMTPDEYRQKWGLPTDYPMVAPNYAEQRSVFAKKIGLGRAAAPRKRATKQ